MRIGPSFAIPLTVWALAGPLSALAGPYEDGDAAFRRKDYAAAMARWRPLAEDGDARAQAAIGSMYLSGLGVVQDPGLAMQWCDRAAEQGNPRAQYLLGSMYRDGKAGEKNLPRAMALFRKSAEKDFAWAQYSLGLMYLVGEGVPVDFAEAYYWLSLAAVGRQIEDGQVESTAAFVLDEVTAKLTADQVRQAQQRIREWQAASRP
jgi:hypothetical protein